jgi:hypothetical protein
MDFSTYPYPQGNITTHQAVELIAAAVYPGTNAVVARKRVRERIRYARKLGKISAARSFPAPDFFRWAIDENQDWAALTTIKGLPRSAILVAMPGFHSISTFGKAYAVVIPADPARLKEEFSRVEVERQMLTEKVAEQEKRIVELEAEVAGWRERDRQYREQRSKAGKNAWGSTRTQSRK